MKFRFSLILLAIGTLFISCNKETPINYNNYQYFSSERNYLKNKEHDVLATTFILCLKNNQPLSYFKSFTGLSDSSTTELIRDLKYKRMIREKNNKFLPTVFIADEKDNKELFKISEDVAEQIAEMAVADSLYILELFNRMNFSKEAAFDKWSYYFIGNLLIGELQLYTISTELLNDSFSLRSYSAIIENENPIKNIFFTDYYIDGHSAMSVMQFGNRKHFSTNWRGEKYYNIATEDYYNLGYIAVDYNKKLRPLLEKDLSVAKAFYQKSHFKDEIHFNVFYYWYYHYVYTNTINILTKKGFWSTEQLENNFRYITHNYCG